MSAEEGGEEAGDVLAGDARQRSGAIVNGLVRAASSGESFRVG